MGVQDHDKFYTGLNGAGYPNQVSANMKTGDRSLSQVVFQAGRPLVDTELNLGQNIADCARSLLIDAMTPSGFVRGVTLYDEYNDFSFTDPADPAFVANTFHMTKQRAIIAGYPLIVEYTGTNTAGDNLITLSVPDAPGAPPAFTRVDFVFLEVWQALVAPSPRAFATVLVNADPANGAIITVDGTALQALLIPLVATDFLITPGNTVATATALAACINLNLATVTADAGGSATVTIRAAVRGAAGNGIVIASVSAAFVISGNTAGGANRLNKPTQETIYRHGNVQSSTAVDLPEELTDAQIDAETAQRVQVQYRIRHTDAVEGVAHDVFPDGFSALGGTGSGPEAQGAQAAVVPTYFFVPADNTTVRGASSAAAYGRLDNGLWIAGSGTQADAIALGTMDGYVYAIPIAMVFRKNLDSFDPVSNTNGAMAYNHGAVPVHPYFGVAIPASTSDRIDGAFADAINTNDILDLRRSIIPAGTNLTAELKYQMQSLMDGNFRSWAIDGGDKQTLGNGSGDISTRHLVCNEVGRTTVHGGVANSSGTTSRGELVREFDHIARRFADQPVTERLTVAFYPGDRTLAASVAIPVTFPVLAIPGVLTLTAGAAHGLSATDLITLSGTDIDGNYAVVAVPLATTFTINTIAPTAGGVGVVSSNDFGEDNNGKYVAKSAAPVSQFHWAEGDALHLDLASLNTNTTGEVFSGGASTLGGPALTVAQCMPAGTTITDIISIFHDDGNYDGATGRMDQQVQAGLITGLGTSHVAIALDQNRSPATAGRGIAFVPEYLVIQSAGDAETQGSRRRIFVEFEITYAMGSGLTDTPKYQLDPDDSVSVFDYGFADGRNTAIIENDPTQRPLDLLAPLGQFLRDGYREVHLDYAAQSSAGGVIVDNIVSQSVLDLVYPRRIYGSAVHLPLFTVTDVSGAGVACTLDPTLCEFGSSSRRIVLSAGLGPCSGEQTQCTIQYYAQDAIPNYGAIGYQISSYFRANAPQTAGTKVGEISNAAAVGTLPQTLAVEPLAMSDGLWTGQRGMGSVDAAYPYDAPLDQLPINDGGTGYSPVTNGTRQEWYFCGSANSSIADFDANTGLLNLHTFVPGDITGQYTMGGAANSQRPRKDVEFRAFYPYMPTSTYRPTILSQRLSGIVRHKVFIPCLARSTADAVGAAPNNGILFRKGELLLLVFVRSADLDADNSIQFLDSIPNRTAVAVYRTRNMLLLAGE